MNSSISGWITKITNFCLHDGPGIRTTIFLKGCPLHCSWCSSPETQNPFPELFFSARRCINCRLCVQACPAGVLSSEGPLSGVRWEVCTTCGWCNTVCPTGAMQIVGRKWTAADVVTEASRDLTIFRFSGGGITISGGEPLYQPVFTRAILTLCKEAGLYTAVDTSGYTEWEHLERIIDVCDLFLFDLKHIDAAAYMKGTGVDGKRVLDNLTRLARLAKVTVRVPIITNFNDNRDTLVRMAHIVNKLTIESVDLLPYHRLGIHQYSSLGRTYKHAQTLVDSESLKHWAEEMKQSGLNVKICG